MERPSHDTDIFSIVRNNPESIIAAAGGAEDELLNFKKRFETSLFRSAFSDSGLTQRALTKAEAELLEIRKRLADLSRTKRKSEEDKGKKKDVLDRRRLLKQLAAGAAVVGAVGIIGNEILNGKPKTNEEIAQEKYEQAKSRFLDGGFLNSIKYVFSPSDWVQEVHTLLNDAIKLNPKHYDAYLVRGILYATYKPMGYGKNILENYNRSMADFNLVIENNPNNFQAYNNRAVARSFFLTDPDYRKYLPSDISPRSIEDFQKAVNIAPDEIYPLGNLYGIGGLRKITNPRLTGQTGEVRAGIERLYQMAGHDRYFSFRHHKFFYKSINGKEVYGW